MSVYKRKDRKGKVVGWRAVIRIKGYPTVCKQCDRKEEADDWEEDTRRRINASQFNFNLHKNQYTFGELLERYRNDGAREHIQSIEDVDRHLRYWKNRFGGFALVHLTSDLVFRDPYVLDYTWLPVVEF